MTSFDQNSIQHYGIKGMEWGNKKKKKDPLSIGRGATSTFVSAVSKARQQVSNQNARNKMQTGTAKGAASSVGNTINNTKRKLSVTRDANKGVVTGISNSLIKSAAQTARRSLNAKTAPKDTATGAVQSMTNPTVKYISTEAKKAVADYKKREAKEQEKLKKAAQSIAKTGTKKVSEIPTAVGSIADKGKEAVDKLRMVKIQNILKKSVSNTMDDRATTVKSKTKKRNTVSSQEWRNR